LPGWEGQAREELPWKIQDAVKSSKVRMVAAYGDYPAHTLYFFVEAKSVEQLHNFADPLLMSIGTTQIHPVAKM